jgi:hypothetical protein
VRRESRNEPLRHLRAEDLRLEVVSEQLVILSESKNVVISFA